MKKKSFIVHKVEDNSEVLIPADAFCGAWKENCSQSCKHTVVVFAGEISVTVAESIQEVQSLYEEVEG